jgi:ABC-type bacteriocin/lantibiotic exporter with double-glycine peptidase domain
MKISPINRFWNILKKYNIELKQIYIYAFFSGIVNLSLPVGIQAIVNFMQGGDATSSWGLLVGFVLLGIAITGYLQLLQIRIVENIQQDIFVRSAFEFAVRMPKIKLLELDKIHAPELANRFFDTLTIQKGMPKILIDFSLALFQIVFGMILLTIYSPYFVLLGLVLVFLIRLIFRFTGPKGLNTSLQESKYKYQMAHWLEEVARINNTIKQNVKSGFHLHKTDGILTQYLTFRERHFQVLISQFGMFIFFKVLLAASLLILGGYLVFYEQMSIGQFVAAEIIIIMILNSIEKAQGSIDTIYDVLTALDKIGAVTDLPLDDDGGVIITNLDKGLAIQAKSIRFSFPDSLTKAIDDLSFDIGANSRVLLAGASGSGKTILMQILAGFHTIQDGELYVNEIPFSNYKKDQLFDRIGIALPVNQIIEGTLRENILLGREVEDRDLQRIIKVLSLEEFLLHQPQGIDSYIDSGGRRLPGSVLQKLAVARAIINKPKLVLLEDPLRFIDEKDKKKIIDYIMSPNQNWTVVVISNHNYWRERCDYTINL